MLSVVFEVDGLLDAAVTGDSDVDVDAVVFAGADVAVWPHPVSIRAAEIAAPANMVIFWRELRLLICIPQDFAAA